MIFILFCTLHHLEVNDSKKYTNVGRTVKIIAASQAVRLRLYNYLVMYICLRFAAWYSKYAHVTWKRVTKKKI